METQMNETKLFIVYCRVRSDLVCVATAYLQRWVGKASRRAGRPFMSQIIFSGLQAEFFPTNHGHDIGQNKSSNFLKDSKSLCDKSLISKCSPKNTNIINDPPSPSLSPISVFSQCDLRGGIGRRSWRFLAYGRTGSRYKVYIKSMSYVNTWRHHSILYIRILI